MLTSLNRINDAHDLLKQALASQGNNLNLRAFYIYFLLQTNTHKAAKEFVFSTLKDHDKHDLYSLCAAGWIMYHQARESRDATPKGIDERKKNFQRSAEFYEKALMIDPMCAIAAQGLAIAVAEDSLGAFGIVSQQPADDAMSRARNAREALDVFAKVRESVGDGSVYTNMGHCFYARDEFERAIESVSLMYLSLLHITTPPFQYETASKRFHQSQNVPVLLCLSRTWYAKANKDQTFAAMRTSLRYAQLVNAFPSYGKIGS